MKINKERLFIYFAFLLIGFYLFGAFSAYALLNNRAANTQSQDICVPRASVGFVVPITNDTPAVFVFSMKDTKVIQKNYWENNLNQKGGVK